MAAVGRLVDPVAGQPSGKKAREGFSAEPVCDEAVRAVRHRELDTAAPARTAPLEQSGQDLDDRGESACAEISDLDRRKRRSGVRQRARVAEVVEVVSGA